MCPFSGVFNIIANTEVGKSTQLGIWRHGSKKTINVILGRMSSEKNLVLSQDGQQPSVELGLTLQEITAQTRQQYKLPDDVKGVVIVDVKDGSPAGKGVTLFAVRWMGVILYTFIN